MHGSLNQRGENDSLSIGSRIMHTTIVLNNFIQGIYLCCYFLYLMPRTIYFIVVKFILLLNSLALGTSTYQNKK